MIGPVGLKGNSGPIGFPGLDGVPGRDGEKGDHGFPGKKKTNDETQNIITIVKLLEYHRPASLSTNNKYTRVNTSNIAKECVHRCT